MGQEKRTTVGRNGHHDSAEYMTVFRITSVAAWLAYGAGTVYDAIWFGRPWSGVFKGFGDALIYALLTGGAFGWLWPEMA